MNRHSDIHCISTSPAHLDSRWQMMGIGSREGRGWRSEVEVGWRNEVVTVASHLLNKSSQAILERVLQPSPQGLPKLHSNHLIKSCSASPKPPASEKSPWPLPRVASRMQLLRRRASFYSPTSWAHSNCRIASCWRPSLAAAPWVASLSPPSGRIMYSARTGISFFRKRQSYLIVHPGKVMY